MSPKLKYWFYQLCAALGGFGDDAFSLVVPVSTTLQEAELAYEEWSKRQEFFSKLSPEIQDQIVTRDSDTDYEEQAIE